MVRHKATAWQATSVAILWLSIPTLIFGLANGITSYSVGGGIATIVCGWALIQYIREGN